MDSPVHNRAARQFGVRASQPKMDGPSLIGETVPTPPGNGEARCVGSRRSWTAIRIPHVVLIAVGGWAAVCLGGCGQVQEMAQNAQESLKSAADETVKNVKEDFKKARKSMDQSKEKKQSGPDKSIPRSKPSGEQESAPPSTPQGKLEAFVRIGSARVGDADLMALAEDPATAALVTRINLANSRITARGLDALDKFQNLEELIATRVSALSGNMRHVNAITSLKRLNVSNNQLVDEDFLAIGGLSNLEEINLVATRITDEGFRCFKDMPNLSVMHLDRMGGLQGTGFKFVNRQSLREIRGNGSSIGLHAFESLAGAPALEVLWLNGARVTDKAMIGIGRCGNLKELHLQKNDLTNDGVKKLERLSKLEKIVLSGNVRLSNPALGSLSKIKSLKMVNVRGTQCSPTVEGEFLKRVPGCDLIF